MLSVNPILLGFLLARPSAPPPATRTLSVAPRDPGSLGAAPQTVAFTVTATSQTQVKWAIFDTNWVAQTGWNLVSIANNTGTFNATFTASGQRVQVKSIDETLEDVTQQVTLGATGAPARPAAAPTQALQLSPVEPGTIAPSSGVARWQTWIGSNIHGSLLYTTVNGQAAGYTFRGDWTTMPLTNGWALVDVTFDTTGQFLKIANPANPAEQTDSGTVTIGASTAPPTPPPGPTAHFVIEPLNPGTIQPTNGVAEWQTRIGSNDLASLNWQVFDGPPGYAARGGWNTVTLTGGWAPITAQFTATGQFVQIADPANTGQTFGSGSVTVPQPTPSPTPQPNPTPTPTPTGTSVARLDILCRGQSNLFYAHHAGGTQALRDIIAHLTQIPDVRLVSRIDDTKDDNTIHSGSFSFFNNTGEERWLAGVGGVNPGLWEARNPMQQVLRAVERFVSTNPDHALLDYRLHWEFDLSVWEEPWASLYRAGTWEITKRIRDKAAKAPGRVLTAYATCSYMGKARNALDEINRSWLQDYADGGLMVVPAAGNQVDGERRTEWDPDGDWSHNNDAPMFRQCVRAGVQLSRRIWQMGWCPAGVDLSWLPSLGPRIASGSRSGSSAFLTIARDPTSQGGGSNLEGGAAGIEWQRFVCNQVGGATGGAILNADTIRVDFNGNLPAGAQITHCNDSAFSSGSDGRIIIRDNWHAIRPGQSSAIPHIGLYDSLLRRTLAPIVLP